MDGYNIAFYVLNRKETWRWSRLTALNIFINITSLCFFSRNGAKIKRLDKKLYVTDNSWRPSVYICNNWWHSCDITIFLTAQSLQLRWRAGKTDVLLGSLWTSVKPTFIKDKCCQKVKHCLCQFIWTNARLLSCSDLYDNIQNYVFYVGFL